jgi:hypothetical protein
MNHDNPRAAEETLAELRRALPHGKFKLRTDIYAGVPTVAVVCPCGRAQPFPHGLDDDLLIRWLADHDDDQFLTPEQRHSRDEAVVQFASSAPDGVTLLGASAWTTADPPTNITRLAWVEM